MNRTLHEADNAQRILKLTADTMLLVDRNGICIDIDIHSNLWFLQEERLLGKNIFELMPEHTREKVYSTFETVLREQRSISKNYKLELKNDTYYFKCIMYPYDDNVLCQYRDITQRSNVKRQLEQVNRNLREIQKVAQIGQWMYNTYDNVFYYMGYTGVLCEESSRSISLDNYQQLIVKEDRLNFTNWCRKNEEGPNEESISYRVRVAGEIYYMRLQAYLREELPNGSCNIEGYIQNITYIQRHRNDINTLTHAINNAKESIFAAKEDGTLIFANRQFLQNHGIPESEEIGKLKIYEIAGDMKTENDWQERCKDILHGGSRSFIAHHPSRISKNILAYEGIMYNVTNDSGEESYWSFSHDISERLHYEAQIKRLNLIMDTTIDNLPAGIVVKEVNNDFRYIYRNRESYNRDLCVGEAIGKNDFDYYPPEVAEKKREEDVLVATTGQGLHWTMEGKDKNGNQLILDKRKIRVDGDELSSPIIVSIEWDITELEKRHTFYEIVEANNERLLQLINEILDLSKIESGIIEFTSAPVNIHSLCKEVYDAHVFRTPQGVKLIYEPSENGLVIETDKNRVFQVFSNLIGNAFKFTKAGSISYGYKLVNKQVVFHVTDTGTGIEPEKIERVFERFAKLNNYAQGTGLGLSICKTIVERLGGEISVSSVVGKGTTFTFTLPYESNQASGDREEQEGNATNANGNPSDTAAMGTFAETSVQDASGSVSGNTEEGCSEGSSADASPSQQTILIAEDEDSNFDLLKAILGRKYRLIRARDGMEAVMSYDEAKPDLILMDIKMPNLDGLEATKIIRELSTTVPIIAQSAYAYQQDQIAAMDVGCNDFIAKPISQAKLKDMINKWLP